MDYGVIGEVAVTVRLPYIDSHLTPRHRDATNAICTSGRAVNLLSSQTRSERKASITLPGNGTRNPDIFFLFNMVGIFSGITSIVHHQ